MNKSFIYYCWLAEVLLHVVLFYPFSKFVTSLRAPVLAWDFFFCLYSFSSLIKI